MNTVHSEKLFTLKEASEVLGVSIDVLLSWNHHNILKPTITTDGQIAYTKAQLDHFQIIRTTMNATSPQMSAYQQTNDAFTSFSQSTQYPTQTKEKYFTKQRIIVFSAVTLFVLFGISLLPQHSNQLALLNKEKHVQQLADKSVNNQTSTLALQQAAPPININQDNDQSARKVQNEGETVLQEQISAPTLYSDTNTEDPGYTELTTIETPLDANAETLGIDTSLAADSYAFTADSSETNTSDASAIDEQGNVRKDTLASLMGSIDDVARGSDLQTGTTDSSMLLLLIFLATGTGMYFFQNQPAFLGRRSSFVPNVFQPAPAPTVEKVMEVSQKTDGTVVLIVLGREYKISKPEMNSESDRFIEHLMSLTYPDKKEIEYNAFSHAENSLGTPLSRLVTRLGFVGIKRDLFFPRTSKTEVLFRKYITSTDLVQMNLTIDQVLNGFTKETN